jgi:AcrR family transcriptional regulator
LPAKRHLLSPPVRRKDAQRGRPSTPFLRERILRSAVELFAEREFDLVLIDEVAAHAGVGKGSVYRQFKSKEELYAAAVIDRFSELQREIRAALAGCTSMREQIHTIVQHALGFFWSRRQFFALLRDPKALPPSQERQFRAQRNDLSQLIRAVLDDGNRRGMMRSGVDTRMAAESLLGMVRGITRYGREYTTPERAVEIITSVFFDGCAPR